MEANFVKKIGEFTPEFLDGISKVFSANATLHIKIEYGTETAETKPTAAIKKAKTKNSVASTSEAPKKRGRKAGFKAKGITETPTETGSEAGSSNSEPTQKKRGRQPGFKPKPKVEIDGVAPKKRGPKPKVAVES